MSIYKHITQRYGSVIFVLAVDTADELVDHFGQVKCAPGSVALIINTGAVVVLNSAGQWIEQSNVTIAV